MSVLEFNRFYYIHSMMTSYLETGEIGTDLLLNKSESITNLIG